MSVFKVKHEYRKILDFSDGKVSKNSIKQSLRQVDVKYCAQNVNGYITIFDNAIKVGMYSIILKLNSDFGEENSTLKQYKKVNVLVCESRTSNEINIQNDNRFSYKSWNEEHTSVDELVDLINHCKRLDDMRVFL